MQIIEKYRIIIHHLADDALFSAASIAQGSEVAAEDRFRLYQALKRITFLHEFMVEGDGLLYIDGHVPTPGWYGRRWKKAEASDNHCRNRKNGQDDE